MYVFLSKKKQKAKVRYFLF